MDQFCGAYVIGSMFREGGAPLGASLKDWQKAAPIVRQVARELTQTAKNPQAMKAIEDDLLKTTPITDTAKANRVAKALEGKVLPEAEVFAKAEKPIPEADKVKVDKIVGMLEKDEVAPESSPKAETHFKQDKAVPATSVKLKKTFETNENVQKVKGMNAKGMADAVQSTGHTLIPGDLVELKVVNGKATEVDLYKGPRDITKIPVSEEYPVLKYEGVGHDGKNPAFVRAADGDLAAAGKIHAGAGRRNGGGGRIYL